MNRFPIFTEVKKVYFTNNLIIYSLFSSLTFLYLLQKYVLNYFIISEKVITFSLVAILLIGIILQIFFSWHNYEPLIGTLETYLELRDNEILVDKKSYPLAQIKTIAILNYDYIADRNYPGKGNFNGILSNGIGNLFKITLLSGEIIEVNFQQGKTNEISSARKELVSYYKNKKITFEELREILRLKKSEHDIVKLIIEDYE